MANYLIIFMVLDGWSHHIDRDNISDDEYEYPNNMVDQHSITMKIIECLSIISSRDDCKSLCWRRFILLVVNRLSSNTEISKSQISSNFIHIHGISLMFHSQYHPLTRDIMVKYERYLMNIDEIRGENWRIEFSSLTKA